ncbi:MAG TPA: DUF1566 domain-containing protein [bacterium]|nr:DUF1566 domain-containing protein [bacterium]
MKKNFLIVLFWSMFFSINSCVVTGSTDLNGDSGDSGDSGNSGDSGDSGNLSCSKGDSDIADKIEGWSELSPEPLWYFESVMYCENLEEGGFTNWRLPRISELRSLVKDCPELEPGGKCEISSESLSGECHNNCSCYEINNDQNKSYSKIGDVIPLWSFSFDPENTYNVWFIDFENGYLDQMEKDQKLKFRCVRSKDGGEESYIKSDIPKPVIKPAFEYTTGGQFSYRNIKDMIHITFQEDSGIDTDKFFVLYGFQMTESPTPLHPGSQLHITDYNRAEFNGIMITPVRYSEKNKDYDASKCESVCGEIPVDKKDGFYAVDYSEHLICRQKYCEEYATKYYKVTARAYALEKKTGLMSETAEITVIPNIIPQARVVAQLTWDKGFRTKTEADGKTDGTKIDIDIHMIKKTSLEAPTYGYSPLEGVMGTNEMPTGINLDPKEPDYERYFRHDDCSFADKGLDGSYVQGTIAWHASLDIDNIWGGNNFEAPETIGLGPIDDRNPADGVPDKPVMDDEYLVVVGYVNCTSQYEDKVNRCAPEYAGEDGAYEVGARLQIFVDGEEVPRAGKSERPSDNYSATTKNFKIKHKEWKVVSVIKWDNSLPSPETNPKHQGSAIVSDVSMAEAEIETDAKSYDICRFDYTDAVLVPIWNQQDYYDWVNAKRNPQDENSEPIGECY